ncbi:cation:proton antiporter [Dermatobacter hominis]|uniref:cation:proton antiporter n=1 Tax=Dermatobacter hominis TaxID=2884263 RepID=UPI001D1246FE|nr:cation:proton antiporter [Dermatobacter hominis]UDY34698.1 cation:proton antiporter [Dermatobacter hominis]
MTGETATSLLLIALAAVLAPVLSELVARWRIPSVLFELLLGIVIGPAVLGLAEVDGFVDGLSTLGLAFLFYVAGYELDLRRIKGEPFNRAATGWVVTVVLGLGVAGVLVATGFVLSELLIGLALTTTAIGTLLPMLQDRGLVGTRFGDLLVSAGAVGEFGPVLAVTIFLGTSSPTTEGLLLIVFVLLALGLAWIVERPRPPRFVEVMERHLESSSQLPVRVVILLTTAMVVVAVHLGLDMLLGAFAAGLIGRVLFPPDQSKLLGTKLQSIGFGFLIPVFFIVSGMQFDLDALTSSWDVAARVPLFLALFLVVRGLPAMVVYRRTLPTRQRVALGVLQSTTLPLLVVITQIGLETKDMRPSNAAALVGAGMLSVLVLPIVGFAVLGERPDERSDVSSPSASDPSRPAP